jgi:hypothetical protein
MAHEERAKTKAGEKETGREISALRFEVLRFLPDGLKLPFALHAISQSKQLTSGVREERRKGVSHVKRSGLPLSQK